MRNVLTGARIAEAVYDDGRVPSAVILERGARRRLVRVRAGALRARLAELLRREAPDRAGLRFAVAGHELTAVVSVFGAPRSGEAQPPEAHVEDVP